MKKYDRITKKYVPEEELAARIKLKKPDTCKGGKEHDFVLVLPERVTTKTSILGIDVAEQYYAIEKERNDMNKEYDQKLKDLGIFSRCGWPFDRGSIRHYVCSVCGKKKISGHI